MIEHAQKERFSAQGAAAQAQTVGVSQEWWDNLNAHPYFSRSKGRTMHLLKESTKPVPSVKKRRKIAALELIPVNPSVLIPNVSNDPPEER